MSWINVSNRADGSGLMSINSNHVVRYFDLGPITYENGEHAENRCQVQLSNGDNLVIHISAREFYKALMGDPVEEDAITQLP